MPSKNAYLSPVQYEALAMVVRTEHRSFRRMDSGIWTLPELAGPPFIVGRVVSEPLWRTTKQTIDGFERRGLVVMAYEPEPVAIVQQEAVTLFDRLDKPIMPSEAAFMRTVHSAFKLIERPDLHGFWMLDGHSLERDGAHAPMIVSSLVGRGWLKEPVERGGERQTWLTAEGRRLAEQKGRW